MSASVKLKVTEPQGKFLDLDCKFPAFVAGFGCVHAETKIITENGLERICDLRPLTRVLSWNEKSQKFQLSLSGGSYPKGKANLYRVSTQKGEFDATAHHHSFSSDCKYVSVQNFYDGQLLKTVSCALPQTSKEFDQLLSTLDVQSYSKIDEDYLLSYVIEARRYGQQFLSEQDIAPGFLPSTNDVHKSVSVGDVVAALQMGDRVEQKQEHNHHDLFYAHACMNRLESRKRYLDVFSEDQTSTSPLEHICDYRKQVKQSLLRFEPRHSIEQHSFDVHSFVNSLSETRVENIQDTGEEVYWDMQVLETNNYVTADGCIHHNTGKSEIMCQSALLDSLEGGSDSLIAMYEPTYDLVRLILAPRMEEKLTDWGIRYKYNKSENIIYTSNGQIGDFVLRTLDNPARIVGYESFRAKIDELDTLKPQNAKEAWNKIIARNRQTPKTYQKVSNKPINTVSAFTTPEGFQFVYERWKKNPTDDYQMVQASTYSNPFLPPDYIDALKATYPENLINAYLNGEFVNLTSGTVYHEFKRSKNNTSRIWDGREPVYIGMDFNVGKMAAIVHVKDNGKPRAVDEIVNAYDTPDMINIIKNRYQNCSIMVYPDASGDSRKSVNASETDIALLRAAGLIVIAPKKNPPVKDRILSMNKQLATGDYLINVDKCPNYAEDLEQQTWNDNGEPDKTQGKDHTPDAGGYFIHKEYPVIKPIAQHVAFG